MAWPLEKRAEAVAVFRRHCPSDGDLSGKTVRDAMRLAEAETGVPGLTLWRWNRDQKKYEDAGIPRPPKGKPGPKPKISNPQPQPTQE